MSSRNIKMYRFTRGEYSVLVSVVENEHVTFSQMKFPKTAPPETQARLLDDAEREALKLHNAKVEKKWLNSTK